MLRVRSPYTAPVLLALGLAACTQLKPGTDTREGGTSDVATLPDTRPDAPPADAPSMETGDPCIDPAGFSGRGCYRCAPTTREQLLNACTAAMSLGVDNSTLPLGDGGTLPMLPPRDAGPEAGPLDASPDAAPTDASADAAPVDAGPVVPRCATLAPAGGSVVYATGSSAVFLFLGSIAQALEHASPPIYLAYQSAASCVGINAMLSPNTTRMRGTATYWDPNVGVDPTSTAARLSCALDNGADGLGQTADLGFSDVFPSTCVSLPQPLDALGLRDFFGPIQTMTFAVPQNSTARALSAEQAFLAYGFGGAPYPVMPWTDPQWLLQRNANSGTQGMIAATIGVPRDRWFGRSLSGSSDMVNALLAAGMMGGSVANSTLGILSTDIVDGMRSQLRVLAFQDYGQRLAFWPDSDPNARDKRNVRDGHYPIWGPLHMVAQTPVRGPVQTLVNAVNGVTVLPNVNVINSYAARGLIPQCAMRVSRSADGTMVSPATPMNSCGCYFEQLATGLNPPPGCTACDRSSQCPASAPNCNTFADQTRGYCEP